MPYDILQLNDMLIPELVDVADTLKIQNASSFDKQALVYKILDQQASNGKHTKEEPKKRRGRKPKEDGIETLVAEAAPAVAEPAEDASGDKKRRARKPKEETPYDSNANNTKSSSVPPQRNEIKKDTTPVAEKVSAQASQDGMQEQGNGITMPVETPDVQPPQQSG